MKDVQWFLVIVFSEELSKLWETGKIIIINNIIITNHLQIRWLLCNFLISLIIVGLFVH